MFLKIKNLLTPAEITRLTTLSRELRFVDGRVSNPANQTKDNLQASFQGAVKSDLPLLRLDQCIDATIQVRRGSIPVKAMPG